MVRETDQGSMTRTLAIPRPRKSRRSVRATGTERRRVPVTTHPVQTSVLHRAPAKRGSLRDVTEVRPADEVAGHPEAGGSMGRRHDQGEHRQSQDRASQDEAWQDHRDGTEAGSPHAKAGDASGPLTPCPVARRLGRVHPARVKSGRGVRGMRRLRDPGVARDHGLRKMSSMSFAAAFSPASGVTSPR